MAVRAARRPHRGARGGHPGGLRRRPAPRAGGAPRRPRLRGAVRAARRRGHAARDRARPERRTPPGAPARRSRDSPPSSARRRRRGRCALRSRQASATPASRWSTRPAGGSSTTAGRVVPEPVAGADRAVTRIVRGDRCIALVVHARGAVAQDELARDIGAAARLAVENERLQAELLAPARRPARVARAHRRDRRRRAAAARAQPARRRAAAAARARLRPASRPLDRATRSGEDDLVAALDDALREGEAALEELRDLAHGIHPAILTEAGLGPALWGLVDQAAIPVQLDDPGAERYAAARRDRGVRRRGRRDPGRGRAVPRPTRA